VWKLNVCACIRHIYCRIPYQQGLSQAIRQEVEIPNESPRYAFDSSKTWSYSTWSLVFWHVTMFIIWSWSLRIGMIRDDRWCNRKVKLNFDSFGCAQGKLLICFCPPFRPRKAGSSTSIISPILDVSVFCPLSSVFRLLTGIIPKNHEKNACPTAEISPSTLTTQECLFDLNGIFGKDSPKIFLVVYRRRVGKIGR
jgi:hypothetical protein